MSELYNGSPCVNYSYTPSSDNPNAPPVQQIDPRIFGDYNSSPVKTPEEIQALLGAAKDTYNVNVPEGWYHVSQKPEIANAIANAAKENNVSPLAIMTLMQKESQALSKPTKPGSLKEKWMTGCGYTDSGTIDAYADYIKQIECTAQTLAKWSNDWDQNYSNTGVDMNLPGYGTYHITDKPTYIMLKYTPHPDQINSINDTAYSVLGKSFNKLYEGQSANDPCKHLLTDDPQSPDEAKVDDQLDKIVDRQSQHGHGVQNPQTNQQGNNRFDHQRSGSSFGNC